MWLRGAAVGRVLALSHRLRARHSGMRAAIAPKRHRDMRLSAQQGFEGSPLDRTVLNSLESLQPGDLSSATYLACFNGRVAARQSDQRVQLSWASSAELAALGASLESGQVHMYVLGRHPDGTLRFAAHYQGAQAPAALAADMGVDMRGLLLSADAADAAMAGHAVALCKWHTAHRFCPKCGSSTEPVSYGTRRQCTADKAHKQYPRTDPVVIMLVESADGQRALLGRSKKIRMHMQTCLSGFVDQCESIEEAVRREVREEVGIEVGAVSIVGSQPWPIGRGGSCELMIGAVATACSEEIALNTDEMAEAAWYDRDALRQAVAEAGDPARHPYYANTVPNSTLGFFIPPRTAIAFSLIQAWVDAGRDSKL